MALDEKDFSIIGVLLDNSKLTTHEISKKLRIPITTVHNRIKRLEQTGVIKGYSALIDYEKIGRGILAYILVTVNYSLPSGGKMNQEELARRIRKLPEVESVSIVTGETDMIIRTRVKSIRELSQFILKKLRTFEGIDKAISMIALNDI
ncbi:MAG: Lrp/AsnC family transcriptional regulator [Candidatus Woesearchaeota archaeon]|nr:Lrp/AsnC family transcriptional regulator [Candidatus Woesearchaeota archaeon]